MKLGRIRDIALEQIKAKLEYASGPLITAMQVEHSEDGGTKGTGSDSPAVNAQVKRVDGSLTTINGVKYDAETGRLSTDMSLVHSKDGLTLGGSGELDQKGISQARQLVRPGIINGPIPDLSGGDERYTLLCELGDFRVISPVVSVLQVIQQTPAQTLRDSKKVPCLWDTKPFHIRRHFHMFWDASTCGTRTFCLEPLQQHTRRLIARILRHEPPAHGELPPARPPRGS